MGVINRSKEEFTLSKKKKKLNGVLVSVLLISLTACNNDDAALNTQNDSDFTNVVNRDGNHNNLYRVNNGSEYTRTPSINNSTATNSNNSSQLKFQNNNKHHQQIAVKLFNKLLI
jgi:hypothetical protein